MSVAKKAVANLTVKHRKRNNYTQEQFAKILGINRVTLCKIENEYKGIVSIVLIEKIFNLLSIDWFELYNEIENLKYENLK